MPGAGAAPARPANAAGQALQAKDTANGPEHSDMRAHSSFALPRLLACYTAPDRGRSAKPARSLVTELFWPPARTSHPY